MTGGAPSFSSGSTPQWSVAYDLERPAIYSMSSGASPPNISPSMSAQPDQRIATLETKVASLEVGMRTIATREDLLKAVSDLKDAFREAIKPVSDKLDATSVKVAEIDTDRKHYATKLWVALDALSASTGLLGFIGQAVQKFVTH